jgi:hypothetical protein
MPCCIENDCASLAFMSQNFQGTIWITITLFLLVNYQCLDKKYIALKFNFCFVTSMVSGWMIPHGHAPYQHNTFDTLAYGVV